MPQIRPSLLQQSFTLGLDSRHPELTSFTIPHAGARVSVCESPILRLHAGTRMRIHTNTRARARAHTCTGYRVIPRCRPRDTAEVMREPGRIVLVRLYYATSPSIHHPFFTLLPLYHPVSLPHVFAKSAFLSPRPDSLVSLYTFMRLIMTV